MVLSAHSVSLGGLFLLAQEGAPLPAGIDNEDCQQGSHGCDKKHFHDHRIARSRKYALYRKFTSTKQKCNCLSGNWNGKEERAALPLDALHPDLSPMCFDDMSGDG